MYVVGKCIQQARPSPLHRELIRHQHFPAPRIFMDSTVSSVRQSPGLAPIRRIDAFPNMH